ncbi:hypothetical protein FNF27_01455 [Cafeteria roenbergensis]|uniref:UBA domain-containing protein n=1 Tax=Cafeteria roenbergensis TaxID=33653 RepID=A0A5A8EGV2_CAFRO|nr:hypothetical protein FNF31_04229 [Cafeteria roenbergensis]KAA0172130.1 hypothetical protein FNF28_00133 [Cafeteria roenbergensis]KAA0177125.1 hypothetical protein FNF27_01455 [Cafeteria roenbergensis]
MSTLHGATLTKAALAVLGIGLFTSTSSPQWRDSFDLRTDLVLDGQVWRILTSQLAPMTFFRGFLAMALLYRMANVERVLGTSRLAALSALASVVSGGVVLAASVTTGNSLSGAEPGPLALVGVMLGVLAARVPPSPTAEVIRVAGVPVTDKTLTVCIGLWLLASGGMQTALPLLASAGLGAAFATDALPFLRHVRCPTFVRDTCARTVGAVIASEAPGAAEARRAAGARARRQREEREVQAAIEQMRRRGDAGRRRHVPPAFAEAVAGAGDAAVAAGAAAGAAPPAHEGPAPAGAAAAGEGNGTQRAAMFAPMPRVEPDPRLVEQLMGMGFEEPQVRAALQQTMNNADAAAARLLDA